MRKLYEGDWRSAAAMGVPRQLRRVKADAAGIAYPYRHSAQLLIAKRSIGILEHTHPVLSSLRDQLADELAALD